MNRCAWEPCGKEFEPTRSDQIYCSEKCRVAAYRKRHPPKKKYKKKERPVYTKTCPYCGKVFETVEKRQIYCCEEHRAAAARERAMQERAEARAEKEALAKQKKPEPQSALLHVDAPEGNREAHIWAKETEEKDMKGLDGAKARETMPSIIPKPRCKLERDVLAARKAGARSYGYYKAFQIIDK